LIALLTGFKLQSIVRFNGEKLCRWGGVVAESGNDDVSSQVAAAFPFFCGQVGDGPHFVGELVTLVIS
jgi:hypothetical protein